MFHVSSAAGGIQNDHSAHKILYAAQKKKKIITLLLYFSVFLYYSVLWYDYKEKQNIIHEFVLMISLYISARNLKYAL